MAAPMKKEELLQKLQELGISTHTVEHPEVFTVEQALPHFSDSPGVFAKNLFLQDKKKALWLYCAPHFRDTKLNDLAKQVGAPGGLRFAQEEILVNTLGVRQGCVTVFGLINDRDHKVKLILDKSLWEDEENSCDGDGDSGTHGDNLSVEERASSEKEVLKTESDAVDSGKDGDGVVTEKSRFEQRVYFHPLVNDASTGVTLKGLKDFLAYTGHKTVISNGQ
ncbi:prolyl-tRNA synthetase associated domain-containing protein 1-like [Littorina saxatilis]|uniref:PrdX deacylase domain-containing protein 1 n=1 Tax=Littorina saxatilis TaxID=31220 RepID=A0AAN9B9D3_9CAEN